MIGKHKDQKKTSSTTTLKEFPSSDNPAASDADCYNNFHRQEATEEPYHKPPKLQAELDRLFAECPKLSAEQALDRMKNAIDPADGGLMYCYAKRGTYMPRTGKNKAAYDNWSGCEMCGLKPCDCNGMLLNLDQVTSAFTTRAKAARKTSPQEDYSAARGRQLGEN